VVSLTQKQAETKIDHIQQLRHQVETKLRQIEDDQHGMLGSTWLGTSAQTYGKTSAQQHEEFQSVIRALNDVVEKGSEHIRSVANADH
jgi:uncharacterized protein YukE